MNDNTNEQELPLGLSWKDKRNIQFKFVVYSITMNQL
jgi:hypothetical protein